MGEIDKMKIITAEIKIDENTSEALDQDPTDGV